MGRHRDEGKGPCCVVVVTSHRCCMVALRRVVVAPSHVVMVVSLWYHRVVVLLLHQCGIVASLLCHVVVSGYGRVSSCGVVVA